MDSEASRFVDEYFNVHERGPELGRGGQGVVFRTRDPDVAVKLVLDGNGQPVTHAGYIEKLRRVRALPVPPGLHLSTPMAVLQGTSGYAMMLLKDMVPFADFWPDPSKSTTDEAPLADWLATLPGELARSLIHYRETGGLARRLIALYKCATVLARLHGAGLVYGDVSPANAFISRNPESRDVWLIDADNLRYETPESTHGVFTPGFGAPELVRGDDGARPRTDCHAFAVMAFSILTMLHPFIGAYVEDGDGGDWADEGAGVDERAYAGLVPWILDEDDDCNRKDNGLVEHVLTRDLIRLFQSTFGPGRTRPWLRPSMFHWPLALSRAADETITCAGCGMGYYVDFSDADQRCPFCDDVRPRVLLVTAYHWRGTRIEGASPAWRVACAWRPGAPNLALPHRLFYPFSLKDGDRDVLELSEENGELRLRCCETGHRIALACRQGGDDTFADFEGMAALPLLQAAGGFWLRVAGPNPRLLRCVLQGHAR